MSNRREDIPSTSDELQIGSWIPVTPVKPGSTDRQPICRNWGEHEAVEANWVKTERLAQTNQVEQASQTGPREFEQKKEPACSSSTTPRNASGGGINWSAVMSTNSNVYEENLICFESWLAGEAAANLRSCENISTNDREKMRDMSFGNLLLAMSKRASMEKALTHNDLAASIASAPYFHPQAESSQPTTSSGTSFLQDQCTVVGKSSIPSKHVLDLNAPSGTITDAGMTKSIPYQFQPLTPEKINRGGYQLEYEMKHSSADKAPTREQNEITRDRIEQQHEKKNSHLVDDQLCEVMSTKLMENHKPDKGGMEETDLVKTTQQKSRRKKHRPKVIIEGQKKRTPKSSAKKAKATQETTRVKRKYVRKNVVTSTLGGGTNRTDLDNKTPNSTEIPVKKRKYRRTQGISKSEDTDNETTETAEIQVPRHTRKSCRRSLSFNPNDTVRDEISSDCPSSNCERELQTKTFNTKDRAETARSTQETEVMAETKDTASRVQTSSMNQLQENFQPRAGPNPESFLPPINKETPKGNDVLTDQTMCTRGKCQILFSDVTHVKEANSVRVSINPDGQRMPEGPSSSIDSGACLPPDKQIQGLKRQNTDGTVERALCSRNEIGITYNSMEAYLSMFTQNADTGTTGLYFPVIHKKNRTEKVYSTVASSIPITAHPSNGMKLEKHTHRDSCKSLFTSPTNQGSYGARSQVIDQPPTAYASNGTQNGRQVFEDLLALGTTQKIKRKRSKGTTHQRLDSLLENCKQWPKSPDREATISRIQHDIEFFNKRLTCIEALEVDARSTMATEKHSKRSMLLNSTAQHVNKYQNFAGTSMGLPPSLTWKNISPVDSIIDKLNRLDLTAENIASEEKYNAFMQYHNYIEEHYALVPFQTSRAIVPFDQVRRRKQRPKVDLDDETTRVWRLLLQNINSEGIDGTNEENAKWWEEERRVFIGRADSFIARMHLVQGDRHFSPWKGSVVDSVVGVFLTQNVSDHLSSSAFMSLAARFPAKQTTHLADFHDKGSNTDINEPGICELDSGDTFSLTKEILNETVFGEDTKTLPKFEYEGISKVNCIKPLQDASEDDSIPEGNLKGSSINTSAGPVISGENIANISVSSNENGKDSEYTLSFESPDIYSQNSADSLSVQTTKKSESSLLSTSEGGPTIEVKPNWLTSSKSFVKLLQTTDSVLHGIYGESNDKRNFDRRQYIESLTCSLQKTNHSSNPTVPAKTIASCSQSSLCRVTNLEAQSTELELLQKNSMISDSFSEKELCTSELSELSSESASGTTYQNEIQNIPGSIVCSSSDEQNEISQKKVDSQRGCQEPTPKMQGDSERPSNQQSLMDATGSSSNIENSKNSERKEVNSNTNDLDNHPNTKVNGPKPKGGKTSKEKENPVDWDQLRQQAQLGGRKRDRTNRTLDSVDWDAIRCADVNEIAQTIKERGMNNKLAERIKDFLNRIVRDHGSIDLEWLRDVPPDKAKEYLLSIRGLGLKSVECVRLLTLHHLAFPVDTNVGRIAVRLGWVPLQPLPESLQLHLLELYPVLESIQQYLWPRLCKLDQKTLYELHYQMITFGKVFCTKSKPNCNACPMRGECRHFASAYASARLALPAPQDKSIVSATENRKVGLNPVESMGTLLLPSPQTGEMETISGVSNYLPIIEEPQTPDTIIEVPATPEPQYTAADRDIECAVTLSEDPDEIPTIHLNLVEFTNNLQTIMQQNMELQEGEMSKALVALTSEAASIPVPKLKNVSRLRTEHQVYELPDSHQLLQGLDKREPDDPCPYLLAIWTPGETMDSIQPPEKRCSSQGLEKLCADETCSSCNSMREAKSQTVRGTLLIPCRTAMRGSFPLNGTYFQVNEVFSDHESSLSPMDIPREWLWNLPRRTVYFGTSIPSIFKGLSTEGIQYCFWRGFVCVRGFDRKTRAPRPLIARLHFPASKLAKGKGKID